MTSDEVLSQQESEWLANPEATTREALRDTVGDGEGLDERVFDALTRKAKAQGWDHAMTHVEMWIKFNLGKDTLFEFEDDDHPNPYEDKLAGEDDELHP